MICLDTNIAIYVMNRRVPSVRHRLAEQLRLGTEISLPSIALFELRYGRARSDRQAEVDRLLKKEVAAAPRTRAQFSIGESVKVTEGPFESFVGVVEEVDSEKNRVKVAVSIFGRATPVELEFTQVEKAS